MIPVDDSDTYKNVMRAKASRIRAAISELFGNEAVVVKTGPGDKVILEMSGTISDGLAKALQTIYE